MKASLVLAAAELRQQAVMARRLCLGHTVADIAMMEAYAVECDAAAACADLAAEAALKPPIKL